MTTTARDALAGLPADTLPEAERNRLLRRVDWRFLGGTPSGMVSVCFTDGMLAQAVAAVSSRVMDVHAAVEHGGCDVAVVVDPDAATLRTAWRALRSGGTCYAEWPRLRAGGPGGVRRRLARAGFVDVACYGARPDPAHDAPRRWIPLESDGATRAFLDSQSRGATTFARRIARNARRLLWSLGPAMRFGRPLCTVARKPEAAGRSGDAAATGSDFVGELTAELRARWSAWGLGPAPSSIRLQLQTGGMRSVNKVIAHVFADDRAEPALVLKLPRVRESEAPLRTEVRALQAIDGRAGAPRLLFATTLAGTFVVGESVVSGTPLLALAHPLAFEELARTASEWITQLGATARVVDRSVWFERLVDAPLDEFVASFGRVLDAGMVRETEARLRTLGALPLVCEHRDFSPWNVLLAPSGALGVLDWEGAEPRGLPALDLIYFLAYWSFFHDGATDDASRIASYRASLNADTRTGAITRECLARYCDHLGIDAEMLAPLRLLVWLIHARSEHRRLVEDAGGPPERRQLDRSLFVNLWREELGRGGRA